jgi:hypothetical protein
VLGGKSEDLLPNCNRAEDSMDFAQQYLGLCHPAILNLIASTEMFTMWVLLIAESSHGPPLPTESPLPQFQNM